MTTKTDITLPPLPEWSKMDDLGGLVPSEVRVALAGYARAAVEADRQGRTVPSAAEISGVIREITGHPDIKSGHASLVVKLSFLFARYGQPAASAEPLVRFCPGCGSIGPVPEQYRNCCPDGSDARMIPQALAEKCRDTFRVAVKALTAKAEAKLHAQSAAPVAQEPVGEVFTMEALDGAGDVRAHVLLTKDLPAGTKVYAAPVAAQAQPTMPPLTEAMRAVLRNEHCVYDSEDALYAALCDAAQAQPTIKESSIVAPAQHPVGAGDGPHPDAAGCCGATVTQRCDGCPHDAQTQPVINQALTTDEVTNALARMDALLDPASGLLTVPDTSATVAASRADLALIRAALAQQPSGQAAIPNGFDTETRWTKEHARNYPEAAAECLNRLLGHEPPQFTASHKTPYFLPGHIMDDIRRYGNECVAFGKKQPSGQDREDAADMFWDADDPERFGGDNLHDTLVDLADDYGDPDFPVTVRLQCAKRLPDVQVVVTGRNDDGELVYEVIDAARAAKGADHA